MLVGEAVVGLLEAQTVVVGELLDPALEVEEVLDVGAEPVGGGHAAVGVHLENLEGEVGRGDIPPGPVVGLGLGPAGLPEVAQGVELALPGQLRVLAGRDLVHHGPLGQADELVHHEHAHVVVPLGRDLLGLEPLVQVGQHRPPLLLGDALGEHLPELGLLGDPVVVHHLVAVAVAILDEALVLFVGRAHVGVQPGPIHVVQLEEATDQESPGGADLLHLFGGVPRLSLDLLLGHRELLEEPVDGLLDGLEPGLPEQEVGPEGFPPRHDVVDLQGGVLHRHVHAGDAEIGRPVQEHATTRLDVGQVVVVEVQEPVLVRDVGFFQLHEDPLDPGVALLLHFCLLLWPTASCRPVFP